MTGDRRPRTTKPILAIFLMLLLCAATATAKYSGGSGEPNDPYRIATPNDLNDIGNHLEDYNKCFVMVNGIDLSVYSLTTSIIAPDTSLSSGFQGAAFTGVFDGNGHSISNLTIDPPEPYIEYCSLFGYIGEGGEVRNLGIENVNVTARGYVGGLCGERAWWVLRTGA